MMSEAASVHGDKRTLSQMLSRSLVIAAFGGMVSLAALRRSLLPGPPKKKGKATRGIGEPLACFQPGGAYEGCVYLDWNATSPIFPEVTAAMRPFTAAHWGNPSSSHVFSAHSRGALHQARARVAAMLGAGVTPGEVLFCSCGSEADNHAIHAALTFGAHQRGVGTRGSGGGGGDKPHIITSAIEHPAILQYLAALHARGEIAAPTLLQVDAAGLVDLQALRDALRHSTVLVTIMHSNNEIGTIEPIADIVRIVHSHNASRNDGCRVLVHTDAAQSCGKVPVLVKELGVDFATVVGHKFGAPKGCAALYVREGNFAASSDPDGGAELPRFPPLIFGGGQEHGRRAGTENVMLAAALGAAAQLVVDQLPATRAHLVRMRDLLRAKLTSRFSGTATSQPLYRVNGPTDDTLRLPNTLSISFRGVASYHAIDALKHRVAFSAGSACHTGQVSVSKVLQACEVPPEFAPGTLRLSVGRHTTTADILEAAALIGDALQPLLLRGAEARSTP